jgi:hypothetical protein
MTEDPTPIPPKPKLSEQEHLQYSKGLARYKELELTRWLIFRKECKAYANNMWINNTCRITDDTCQIDSCFALQLIKLTKGYF